MLCNSIRRQLGVAGLRGLQFPRAHNASKLSRPKKAAATIRARCPENLKGLYYLRMPQRTAQHTRCFSVRDRATWCDERPVAQQTQQSPQAPTGCVVVRVLPRFHGQFENGVRATVFVHARQQSTPGIRRRTAFGRNQKRAAGTVIGQRGAFQPRGGLRQWAIRIPIR